MKKIKTNKKVFGADDITINISPMLQHKLDIMTSEYSVEVGGYLTGRVEEGNVYIDDILIPPQIVTGGSVNIEPGDQIALYKKYGTKCQKIIGHFHSHNTMGCFWSNVDLVNMRNIMGYKDFYVFIVGSVKKYLVKICTKKPFKAEFDNVDLYIKSTRLDGVRKMIDGILGLNNDQYVSEDVSEVEVVDEDENINDDVQEVENYNNVSNEEQEEAHKEFEGSYIG